MLVVAFNGPPRVGKDTAGALLERIVPNSRCFKYAQPLKRAVHMSFGLLAADDYFEARKDEPAEELFGAIPRQAYIRHAEEYMKVHYGSDIFGKILARQLKPLERTRLRVAIITDAGFQEELNVIGNMYQTILVRLFKEGCDFKRDSRGYLGWETSVDMQNNGTIEDLKRHLQLLARQFNLV